MNFAGRLDTLQRGFNWILHVVASLTLVVLLLWTVGDIIGRTFFSHPFRGTVELTELSVVILVYLGLARAENEDAHIAADLFYVRLGLKAQNVMRIFAGAVSFIVISVMSWRLFVFAGQMDSGGYTTGVLRIPLYPVAMLGVLGSISFALAVLANLAGSVRETIGDERR